MFDRLEIFRMAHGMAVHAGARQSEIAQNVANADTPGYRARDLKPFSETYTARAEPLRATREGHLDAAAGGLGPMRATDAGGPSAPNGNSVTLEAEMIRAAEVKQSHEMALSIYKTSLGILRSSIGRR